MNITKPQRLLEISRAIASGEDRVSIVRRFAQLWGCTERTIYNYINRALNASARTEPTDRPIHAQPLMASTVERIEAQEDEQWARMESARAFGNYHIAVKVFREICEREGLV